MRGLHVLGWPSSKSPAAPEGFRVQLFARNIESPRWLLTLPNGDVLVAQSSFSPDVFGPNGPPWRFREALRRAGLLRKSPNTVTLLHDVDGDGISDIRKTVLTKLDHPFGMAIIRENLYVAATNAIWRYFYQQGYTPKITARKKIMDLPAGSPNAHWTRSLIANANGDRLYVSVGSATDVDIEAIDRFDPRRASILEVNLSTGVHRIFASGLRNPIGLDWEDTTEQLWTVVNERDNLGPELPPDYLTAVADGAYYGWPAAYFGQNEDPSRSGQRPDLVARTQKPDHGLGAHSAPLGLLFQRHGDFPEPFRNGVFVSQHGSMRAAALSSPRVVFVPFINGHPAGPPIPFLTGFVADATKRDVYGRPAGLAQLPNGNILVADDAGDCIWVVIVPKSH